jgi:L-fuculose-phosphate aldolase
MKAKLYLAFQQVGADLFDQHLASATSGNFSVRVKEGIWITRSGVQKGHLSADDLMLLPLEADQEKDAGSSVERIIHRAVYAATDALAVVHAHPRYAIALSYHLETIEPIDLEGQYYLPTIPVLNPASRSASPEAAEAVAQALKTHHACILRGHGAFVKAREATPEQSLLKAYSLMTSLEEACEILYHHQLLIAAGRKEGL